MGFIHNFQIINSTAFFFFFFIFILLLSSSSTHATTFMPQGVSNSNLFHKYNQIERRSLLIGSRPPRCEKIYCRNCGRCEAVQVPIVPRFLRTTQQALGTTPRSVVDTRGDDISNYKPMCWKCKCGNLMFNP